MNLKEATKLINQSSQSKVSSSSTEVLKTALIKANLRLLDCGEGLLKESYKEIISFIESELKIRESSNENNS